jgi:hypothetical protein
LSVGQPASQPSRTSAGLQYVGWLARVRLFVCVEKPSPVFSLFPLLGLGTKISPIVLAGILSSQFFPSRTTSE